MPMGRGDVRVSMPKIPEELYRPSLDEVLIDLLKSIAMEETALSHLLNAESEKILAFVGRDHNFPTNPSREELQHFNRDVQDLVEVVLMKEWILYRKLKQVASMQKKLADFCEEEE